MRTLFFSGRYPLGFGFTDIILHFRYEAGSFSRQTKIYSPM